MRKFTTILLVGGLLLSLSASLSAQRYGLKVGLNLADQIFNNYGDFEPQTKFLATFKVGAVAEFDITETIGISTGLELSGKGAADDEEDFKGKINPFYLQVPIHLAYQNNGFILSAGPYVGFGLFGKITSDDEEQDIDFGNSVNDTYSPLDYGLGLGIGYQLPLGLRLGASFDYGLANLLPGDVRDLPGSDAKSNHMVIGVYAAYMFGDGGN